jgi:hypothetical protein
MSGGIHERNGREDEALDGKDGGAPSQARIDQSSWSELHQPPQLALRLAAWHDVLLLVEVKTPAT